MAYKFAAPGAAEPALGLIGFDQACVDVYYYKADDAEHPNPLHDEVTLQEGGDAVGSVMTDESGHWKAVDAAHMAEMNGCTLKTWVEDTLNCPDNTGITRVEIYPCNEDDNRPLLFEMAVEEVVA